MRYQVGQKIWTMFVHLPLDFMYPSYRRFMDFDKATEWPEIEFVELEVLEHHKVRGEWDSEDKTPTNDGFILQSAAGQTWHNQYPIAHYGQLDDTCDGLFRLDINTTHRDLGEKLLAMIAPKKENHQAGEPAARCDFLYETYDMRRELRSMHRSMHTLLTGSDIFGNRDPDQERGEKLRSWHDHVISEFTRQTGLEIIVKPHHYTTSEGESKHLPGWYDYTVAQVMQQPVGVEHSE